MFERSKVYFEAIGFLVSGVYQKMLKSLDNETVFAWTAALVFVLLGWLMLFHPYIILIILGLSFLFFYKDIRLNNNIIGHIASYFIIFLLSLLISCFYTIDNTNVTTQKLITDPIFEVTSDSNIILQRGNPSLKLDVSSDKFAIIKNSNCKKIEKVRISENNKMFSYIYASISSKITCDGKEIK